MTLMSMQSAVYVVREILSMPIRSSFATTAIFLFIKIAMAFPLFRNLIGYVQLVWLSEIEKLPELPLFVQSAGLRGEP